MRERYPDDDVVLYAGTFATGDGGYRWQYGLPTATILDGDFADGAPALSALAHPVRLTLLQAVLAGTHQTAELSALPGLGTSGQVYHHLNQLAEIGRASCRERVWAWAQDARVQTQNQSLGGA